MRFIGLICIGLSLQVSAGAYAATDILVFGDSLSAAYGIARREGWVALLEKRLAASEADVKVSNASVSGETSAGGRSRLPAALEEHQPDVVILELGANDGLRALPIQEMQSNLAAMIADSRQAGATVLLLGMRIPTNYGQAYSKRFHQAYDELANTTGIAYVPFFLDPIALERQLFQADGVHPSAAAQPLLLQHVWPELKPLVAAANVQPAER